MNLRKYKQLSNNSDAKFSIKISVRNSVKNLKSIGVRDAMGGQEQ